MAIFKNHAEQQVTSAGKSTQRRARPNFIPALVTILAGVLSILVFEFLLLPWQETGNVRQQSQLLAQRQTAQVDLAIEQIQFRLQAYGQSNALRQVVAQPDMRSLQAMNDDLAGKFPEAVDVQVIPLDHLGIAGIRRYDINLRNNIEANLLTKLQDDEPVNLEAYKLADSFQFTLLAAVRDNESSAVRGAILLRMPVDFLQAVLAKLGPDSGKTQLIQTYLSRELQLTQAGQSVQDSVPAIDVKLADSAWLVRFSPGSEVIENSAIAGLPFWIVLAVPFLLGALWLLNHFHKSSLRNHDRLVRLTEYLQILVEGSRPKPPVFDDDEFNHLAYLAGKINPPTSRNVLHKVEGETSDAGNSDSANSAEAINSTDADIDLTNVNIPETIFRAYDIRGIAERDLTDAAVYALGMAIGSEAAERGQQTIVIAADGRHSSPRIKQHVTQGLIKSGQNVIDIGQAPTPLLYFATHHLETQAGVMITGSHNAAEYNGLKLVLEGRPLAGEHIQRIRERVANRDFRHGVGSYQEDSVTAAYVEIIRDDVAVAQSLKVVVDAGNGVAGEIAPLLLEALGCEVVPLFCEVDGSFPNHEPDPSRAENMQQLASAVTSHAADLGVAFDGDGDRIGVVTSDGTFVEPDRLLMLFAQDIVSRNPGADIVYDIKCTRHLNAIISNFGGRPIMWKSGHSCIKEKMLETGALLGGEYTGHICFKERWFGFDDGIYSAARLIEIITTSGLTIEDLLAEFPVCVATPEIIVQTGDEQKFAVIESLLDSAQFGSGKITTLDGIRVDYPDGWGLVRASNTVPALTLRFEADTDIALQRIKDVFREQLGMVNPQLATAF